MARARNIKPGFFSNELLADIPAIDRLLFIGLWCLADREGRLEDRPKRIKIEILPCDEIDVDASLDRLSGHGFLSRYSVDGKKIIEITNFSKHQNPHGSERDSALPDADGYLTVNERARNVVITGKARLVHVDEMLSNVKTQLDKGDPKVIERPDSPILRFSDSPIPDSLNPLKDQEPLSPEATPAKRKTKIPDPFMLTAEMRAWAAESAPAVNLKNETEAFVDYWRGEAKTKADWPATWRNWIRRAQGDMNRPGRRGTVNGISKQEQIQAANQRVVEEIIARQSAGGDQVDFDLGDPIVIEGEVIRAH